MTTGPVVVVLVDLVMLADSQQWTSKELLGPALLILIGAAMIAGVLPERRRRASNTHHDPTTSLVMFGGTKIKDRSEHQEHADVSAIFGGAELDLREAHIDGEATVDVTAIFGGVDVLVPHDGRVTLGGLPIFGGYDDRTRRWGAPPPDAPTLHVNATAIFGGVNVAHERS